MASVFVYHSLNDLRRPYISRPSFWTILDFSNDVTMSPLQSVYHILSTFAREDVLVRHISDPDRMQVDLGPRRFHVRSDNLEL